MQDLEKFRILTKFYRSTLPQKSGSSGVSQKYNILLLDRNTRFTLWKVKMRAILTQMDLEEALLGSNKMSSSWTAEEKQKKIIKL